MSQNLLDDDSDILTILYNACDPKRAAAPEYYVNFSEARGEDAFVHQYCRELERTHSGYAISLFTGHQGCGKSSELQQLAHELQKSPCVLADRRYFPIVINAKEYMDTNNASLPEILLSLVAQLAADFKEKLHIELKDTFLEKRFAEIAKMLNADLHTDGIEMGLWGFKTKVPLKLADTTVRDSVRAKLTPQLTSLVGEINLVLTQARTRLAHYQPEDGTERYADLVLIFDNLEKIGRVGGREAGEDSYRAIFIEGSSQLSALQAHIIYTVPLSLVRSSGTPLKMEYGTEAFVLPSVKIEKRGGHDPAELGRECLKELLAKRVFPFPLNQAFHDDALDLLIHFSGGHTRQLMTYARSAILNADAAPLTRKNAFRAVSQQVRLFDSNIHNGQWELLAHLENSPLQKWDNSQTDQRTLLEGLAVLEYYNGGESEDNLEEDVFWYAVHPAVRELRSFKNAVAALKAADAPVEKAP